MITVLGVVLGVFEVITLFGMFYYGAYGLIKLSIKKLGEVVRVGIEDWKECNVYNELLYRQRH